MKSTKIYTIEEIQNYNHKDGHVAVHIKNEKEYNRLKQFSPHLSEYVSNHHFYLVAGGLSDNGKSYANDSGYCLIEFNQIIFENYEIY